MTTCGFTVLSGGAGCGEQNRLGMVCQENLAIFVHLE